MASHTVYDAVRSYFDENWTTTAARHENDGKAPLPTDENGGALPYVLMEMSGTLYAQMSIGASDQADNRWDEEGLLWFHVYVPAGTGSSLARQYAKQIADLFRGTTLLADSLEFLDAQLGMGEPGDEAGTYWRLSVSIEWRRMEA